MKDKKNIPYLGSNILFLEEIISELEKIGLYSNSLLYRASEQEELGRIIKFGTDRGGFPGNKTWEYSYELGRNILHEDVIYATTEAEIRKWEKNESFSTSLKKFSIIENPLLLVYDSNYFKKVGEKQYMFLDTKNKHQSLLAIFIVKKFPEIQGWFNEEEGLFYRSLVKLIKNGTVVEVGNWKGRSTSFIGRVCMANNTKLYCIDNWNGSSDEFDREYRKMLRNEDVELIFKQNMENLGISVLYIKKPSVEASSNFDSNLDLVFIDASHDYQSVKADLEAWYPKLKDNCILAGHDFSEDHFGVIAAVQDFVLENKLKLMCGGGSIWYTRK